MAGQGENRLPLIHFSVVSSISHGSSFHSERPGYVSVFNKAHRGGLEEM